MKKQLLSIILISSIGMYSGAKEISFIKGWNNIGLSYEYNITSIANSNIDVIWHYNNKNKKWEVYSEKYKLPSNYSKIDKTIKAGDAVWVFSDINQNLDIPESVNRIISSYDADNKSYKIVEKGGNYYFDYNENDFSKEFPIEINGIIKNASIRVFDDGNVLFDIIAQLGKDYNDINSTGYLGYIKNDKLFLTKIGTSKYLDNWGDIYKLENGEYLTVFSTRCCEAKTYLTYYNPDNNEINIKELDNTQLINTITSNDYLKELVLYNGMENKTMFYNFNVQNSPKEIILNGDWSSYQSIENKDIFISRYNYSNGNKIALYDNNGNLISKHSFDKIIRAVGIDYLNNTIFVFAHNDVNETLDIYSSNDYGKTWDKNLTINNFNYMINYVNDVHQTDNGLSLSMMVNNYSLTIKTDDSFKTIKRVNYRKNQKQNKQNIVEYYEDEKIIRY